MREDQQLVGICQGVDRQLEESTVNPGSFIRELREKIRKEKLASRFRPVLNDNARSILRSGSSGIMASTFPEGEVSLKRSELLNQLDGTVSTQTISLGDIDLALELAVPRMRSLLIHFEFAKMEM